MPSYSNEFNRDLDRCNPDHRVGMAASTQGVWEGLLLQAQFDFFEPAPVIVLVAAAKLPKNSAALAKLLLYGRLSRKIPG